MASFGVMATATPSFPSRGTSLDVPEEEFLVHALIDADWNRRRFARIETQLMNLILKDQQPAALSLAALFDPTNPASRALERVIRHREAAERSWHRAYNALMKVIKNREKEDFLIELTQTTPPERTQFQPPLPTIPKPAPAENLALRL